MKHWLALAALICFGSSAARAAVEVVDVKLSSMTFKTVVVSTSVPTPLFSASLQGTTTDFYDILRSRDYFEIQNIDPSTTTYATCTMDVSSSVPAANLSGSQAEYSLAPSTFSASSLKPVGRVLLPAGLNGLPWKPAVSESNNAGLMLVPWCMCYNPFVKTGASACNLTVTQGAGY